MDYTMLVEPERRDAFIRLIETIDAHLPEGFEKTTDGKGVHYVVPFHLYPDGYHVTPDTPLPFLSVIAQKRHVAVYHLGIYADVSLLDWFKTRYESDVPTKLDMGKSCIRFKNVNHIPYTLIGELVEQMTPSRWIQLYETNRG